MLYNTYFPLELSLVTCWKDRRCLTTSPGPAKIVIAAIAELEELLR